VSANMELQASDLMLEIKYDYCYIGIFRSRKCVRSDTDTIFPIHQ